MNLDEQEAGRSTDFERNHADPDHYRRQLRTVAENATLALFIMDEQQRCSYMNPAAERLTGFRLDELQGQALHYYVHHTRPDGSHYPLEECPIDRAFPQNMREQGEEVFVHKDGHLYPVSFTASPIRQDERIVGTIIEARDITEDRRQEAERLQFIEDLRRERARLADLFELAPAFIATLSGPDHVFELANDAYKRLVGGRNVVGQTVAAALPEVVEQGFIAILDQVRTSGEPYVGTEVGVQLRAADGRHELHFVNFIYQPITERDGSISGIFVHGVDVSHQVRARREVEELKAQLDLALDSARIGTWDYDLVTNELAWDSRTREIFGVGPNVPVDYDLFLARLHADDRDPANRAVDEALAGANDGYFQTNYRVMQEDGSCRWVQASGQALLEEEGAARKAVRFTGTAIDVTDRVSAEAERERLLRETEVQKARLQQVFVDAPAVIAMYSGQEHVITMANPMWETVLGRRDVIGKRVADLFPELVGTSVMHSLDQVRVERRAIVGNETEIHFDRGSGLSEPSWWNFVFQPIFGDNDNDDVSDIFVHAVEVTDQVRARRAVEEKADELTRVARALESSNRELDQFAYVASHDLKAPLRGIANLSQWIEEDIGTQNLSAESREHLSLLRGRVHRMEALIDGILHYSRAGRVREKVEQVNVRELIDEVIDLLSPPTSVRLTIAPDLPMIETERLPLQQVFQNLIGNAIKYTRRSDAQIAITGSDAGAFWEFAVSDNGPGIAPEYHSKIFGLFQTLEARDKVEATGIGLSIVQKTVESRGGSIRVESEAGNGTTFHFTWPKKQLMEARHA